jgi:hypothetical protein
MFIALVFHGNLYFDERLVFTPYRKVCSAAQNSTLLNLFGIL